MPKIFEKMTPLRRTLGLFLLLTPAIGFTGERSALAAGPHYKRLCDPATEGGQKTCHAWLLVGDDEQPVVSAAPNGLGATDLAEAYHLPKTGGNGRIIATQLGTHYPNAEADLNVYRKQYGLPECTKANGCFIQVDDKGGTNFPPAGKCNGLLGESSLDIEMLSAGCPDCKIMLIEPNGGSDQGIPMAIQKGAVGISFSWGGGESSGDLRNENVWTHPGIGLFAATGDSGFMGPGSGRGTVQSYPASSAGVVAVGGTTLKKSTSARGWDETIWNGAGSGCSTVIPKPAWQTDTGCSMRMVADISAIADNVAVYCTDPGGGGGWSTAGGTSAASPFATGALAVTGVLNGSFNPAWLWQHAQDFYDITAGSNGTCTTSYYCKGGTGYDGPSGLGTPNGDALTGGAPPPGDGGLGTGGSGGTGGGDSGSHGGAGGSKGMDAGLDAGMGGATMTTSGSGGTTGAGGSAGGSSTSTGAAGSGTSTTSSSGSGGATSGAGGASSGAGGSAVPPPSSGDSSGCSCKLATADRQAGAGAMLVALALALAGALRKRRRLDGTP